MIEGDEDFRSQVGALLPKLRRFALALTGTAHDADDVVQSAIEKALSREEQFRPGTRLDSWMYRIVQNLWIDQTRGVKRRGEHADVTDPGLHIAGEDGREVTERRLMLQSAWRAFETLSPELRSAAALVILNGASYQEAADTLQVPIGTIMSRVARSRRALEQAIGGAAAARGAAQ
jgi:RNA polymerase sigma-70 factor (ECF subfamily)